MTPLVCGSKLALCPKEKIVDIEGFKKFSRENKITDIVIMPSLIKLLLEFEYDFSKIKEIFITGEHCDEETINRLKAQRSRMKIFSLYGQSECAGHALSVEQGSDWSEVYAGFPSFNTTAVIVNDEGNIAKHGEEGNLYLASPAI